MKWYCLHDWSAWSEIVNTYTAPYQFRYCNKCNLIKRKRQSLTNNEVDLAVWNHGAEITHEL